MSCTDEILHDLNEAYAAEERALMEREMEEQAAEEAAIAKDGGK